MNDLNLELLNAPKLQTNFLDTDTDEDSGESLSIHTDEITTNELEI